MSIASSFLTDELYPSTSHLPSSPHPSTATDTIVGNLTRTHRLGPGDRHPSPTSETTTWPEAITLSSSLSSSRATTASSPQSTVTSLPDILQFSTIRNATVCGSLNISWAYDGSQPFAFSLAVSLDAQSNGGSGTQGIIILNGVLSPQRVNTFLWSPVDVLAGTYVAALNSPDLENSTILSNSFPLLDSSNHSCLTTGSSTPVSVNSSGPLTATTSTHTQDDPTAAPNTRVSMSNAGPAIGGTIGVVIIGALVSWAIIRRRRKKSGNNIRRARPLIAELESTVCVTPSLMLERRRRPSTEEVQSLDSVDPQPPTSEKACSPEVEDEVEIPVVANLVQGITNEGSHMQSPPSRHDGVVQGLRSEVELLRRDLEYMRQERVMLEEELLAVNNQTAPPSYSECGNRELIVETLDINRDNNPPPDNDRIWFQRT